MNIPPNENLNKSATNAGALGHSLKPPVDNKKKRSTMGSSDLGHIFLKDAVAD